MAYQDKILRLPEVIEIIGLSKATIYLQMRNGTFPQSIHLGANSRGWVLSEINSWLDQRIAERDEVV